MFLVFEAHQMGETSIAISVGLHFPLFDDANCGCEVELY